MGLPLMIFGGILALVGSIKILIEAFSTSILWGIGSLVIPFVALFFVATHWHETKGGFMMNVAGMILFYVGIGMSAPSAEGAIPLLYSTP